MYSANRFSYPFASGAKLRMEYDNVHPNSRLQPVQRVQLKVKRFKETVTLPGMPLPRFRNPAVSLLQLAKGDGQTASVPQDTNTGNDKGASSDARITQGPTKSCSCHRPSSLVICCWCGYIFRGNVRRQCPDHSNQLYLMDHSCCPKCKTATLREVHKRPEAAEMNYRVEKG